MKDTRTTLERVQFILREDMGYREECLAPDARFDNDIGMDSMDMVELITEVECEFDIVIEDVDAAGLATIGELVKWIDDHPEDNG